EPGSHDVGPGRLNGQGQDFLIGAAEGQAALASLRVDQAGRPVLAGGHEPVPLGAERDRVHEVRMAGKRHYGLAGRKVPDPNRLVEAGGYQQPAVRAECYRADTVDVSAADCPQTPVGDTEDAEV